MYAPPARGDMDFDQRCDNATWAATRTFTTYDRAGYDDDVVCAKLEACAAERP